MNTLMGFVSSGQTEGSFNSLHASLDKLLKLTARKYSEYIESCNTLFTSNTLYSSSSVEWKSDTKNYVFDFDTLPKVVFPVMNLVCYAKKDSSVIALTKGVYYPTLNLFYGDGGKVNFLRAGIGDDDASAVIRKYVINLKSSEYAMDSATLTYKKYFAQDLKGRYTDKILADINRDNATYPRFYSYQTNLQIKDLIQNADYKGGFSLQGNKLVGAGNANAFAQLTYFREGKPQMVLRSKGFVVKGDRIVSDNAAAIIYFDRDSIFHPGVEFKYINDKKEITLTKNAQTAINSPYFDSYHKMDLDFEQLVWKVGDAEMDLKMISGASETKLRFESINYFNIVRFEKIQGISTVHPLYTIKQFCEKNNSKVVYIPDLAKDMHLNENEVRNLMVDLSTHGFVAYDSESDRAIVKDKSYYYLNARTGKVDYDEIFIESLISGKPNAKINLLNFDINMEGVSKVLLSDSQQVYIMPSEQQLTLKKNRDLYFGGRVHAGRLDFFGKEFVFHYDDFKVDLKTVDSLRFKVPADTLNSEGKYPLIPIKSVMQNLVGGLAIDKPGNKSGKDPNNDFPVFTCTNKSFIYYDYAYIFNKVYNRDKFYYHVDPFTIDSLNTLRKEGLVFEGTMVSAGIFPDFAQTLSVQEDYSLGFKTTTPDAGFAAYGGKGVYHDKVFLSHKGFRGDGTIDYLTSTSKSNDIIFFPDSTHANTQAFEVKREALGSTKFPHIKANDVFVNWRPKQDKMYVFKKSQNMSLYDGQASLDGNLILMPSGINANGVITFEQSQLVSEKFDLKDHNYGADSSDFSLKSDMPGILALQTKNVKSDIDLEKRIGTFNSNGTGSNVTFPINQYISNIQNFKWFMDKSEMEFGSATGASTAITQSEFTSIHPQQDSLRFSAPLATYSLTDYLIKAYKVKEILVADASIIPDSGKVVVEKAALMRTLNNSRVIANTTTKYHTMLNTSINVRGRKSYQGTGDYEYMDQSRVKHLIKLTNIGVDSSIQTFAVGEIPDTADFSISPTIQYKGKIRIQAFKENLYFSGFAHVNHHCDDIEKNWFSFASDIDPHGVNIPVNNPVNETSERLFAGIYFGSDSSSIYPAFLSKKKHTNDAEILSAQGLLTFDNNNKQYKIAGVAEEKPKKKEDKDAPKTIPVNNSLILDDRTCNLKGDGAISLATNFGQLVLKNYGQVTFITSKDSIFFDLVMNMDFLFPEEACKIMADVISAYPTLSPTNDTRDVYKNVLLNTMGKEKSEKYITETSLYGAPKRTPEELQHTLSLTDLKLYWNKEKASYISVGQIGVGVCNKYFAGKMMTGNFEISRRRSGDVLNLYLEVDNNIWFFFNYNRGVLQAISSEQSFNTAVDNVKADKKVAKEKDGAPPFEFMLSTERKKSEFLKRLKDGK
jgi:hypothetical protein